MQRKFRITVDGQPYEVMVEEITEGGRLIPQPGDMQIPQPQRARAPTATPAPAQDRREPAAEGEETSPLAGVVESIPVTEGEEVKAGAAIAVLEAMKMKTTVVASRGGRIAAIRVKTGQSVDAGQALMRIE